VFRRGSPQPKLPAIKGASFIQRTRLLVDGTVFDRNFISGKPSYSLTVKMVKRHEQLLTTIKKNIALTDQEKAGKSTFYLRNTSTCLGFQIDRET
jgi:hypothetical protein